MNKCFVPLLKYVKKFRNNKKIHLNKLLKKKKSKDNNISLILHQQNLLMLNFYYQLTQIIYQFTNNNSSQLVIGIKFESIQRRFNSSSKSILLQNVRVVKINVTIVVYVIAEKDVLQLFVMLNVLNTILTNNTFPCNPNVLRNVQITQLVFAAVLVIYGVSYINFSVIFVNATGHVAVAESVDVSINAITSVVFVQNVAMRKSYKQKGTQS